MSSEPNEQDRQRARADVANFAQFKDSAAWETYLETLLIEVERRGFRRGQSDMVAKAASLAGAIEHLHYTDHMSAEQIGEEIGRRILALSPDPSYAATLRDEIAEKVNGLRAVPTGGAYTTRQTSEQFCSTYNAAIDDVLAILEKGGDAR